MPPEIWETATNLASLPRIQGGGAFQQYILHKKIRQKGLVPDVVAYACLNFQRQKLDLATPSVLGS